MPNADPINKVNAQGWRVIWVGDLNGDVLLVDDHHLALADVTLSRQRVAELLTAALLTEPGRA